MNFIEEYYNHLNDTLNDDEKYCLPHLFGLPWYEWAWQAFTSTNQYTFLCAANQISKSSTMIRRCILMATAKELWPKFWPLSKTDPDIFWYFYPSKDVGSIEILQKWVKQFLPRKRMQNHKLFGWKIEEKWGNVYAIHFNSGVSVYLKSYDQRERNLQTASVFSVFVDEEMPEELYDEVQQRFSGTIGYYNMCFTATLGQRFWYETIEIKGKRERFRDAKKIQVSKFDCLTYRDGSESPWTKERINKEIANCRTEAEVQRRIYGRFVRDDKQLFYGFQNKKNTTTKTLSKADWFIYSAMYLTPEGRAAFIFIRTNPELTYGEIFDAWESEDYSVTALEAFLAWKKHKGELKTTQNFCDVRARDFMIIAGSLRESFTVCRKPRDNGEKLINSLLRSSVIKIVKNKNTKDLIDDMSLARLDDEDFIDNPLTGALIVGITNIPWSFDFISGNKKPEPKKEIDPRMRHYLGLDNPEPDLDATQLEMSAANDDYEFTGYN